METVVTMLFLWLGVGALLCMANLFIGFVWLFVGFFVCMAIIGIG